MTRSHIYVVEVFIGKDVKRHGFYTYSLAREKFDKEWGKYKSGPKQDDESIFLSFFQNNEEQQYKVNFYTIDITGVTK